MRFKGNMVISILILIQAGSCRTGPEPIAYGSDACNFCRMTIVDQQHGAELVTAKGKVYKFDAVECMLNYLGGEDEPAVGQLLVNTYTRPGQLMEASRASYLVSEGIPSPMGANLTAFESNAEAAKAQEEHGGDVYSWNIIRNRYKE